MTAKTNNANALTTTTDDTDIVPYLSDMESLAAIIEENGGEGLSERDLDTIKMPAAGGLVWEIPNPDDGDKPFSEPEITGVIVKWKKHRVFYATEFTGEKNPADCYSRDGVTGIGNPGGKCAKCPLAAFHRDPITKKGVQASCKHKMTLYILQEGATIPVRIDLPSTSAGVMSKFFSDQGYKAKPNRAYWHIETTLTLKKVVSNTGIKYSLVVPTKTRDLNTLEKTKVKQYMTDFDLMLNARRFNPDDDENIVDALGEDQAAFTEETINVTAAVGDEDI